MKKLLLSLPLLALTALGAQAQGYVMFANVDQNITVEKRISDLITGDYLTSAYVAQLFVGPNGALESVLTAVDSPVAFLDSPPESQGDFLGNELAIAGYNPGDTVTFEVRVWPTIYATWGQAYGLAVNDSNIHVGRSGTFSFVLGTQGSITELVFSMPLFAVQIVPEPSAVALGALGLGAMFLRRRKA